MDGCWLEESWQQWADAKRGERWRPVTSLPPNPLPPTPHPLPWCSNIQRNKTKDISVAQRGDVDELQYQNAACGKSFNINDFMLRNISFYCTTKNLHIFLLFYSHSHANTRVQYFVQVWDTEHSFSSPQGIEHFEPFGSFIIYESQCGWSALHTRKWCNF